MPARKEPWLHACMELIGMSNEVKISTDEVLCCCPPMEAVTQHFHRQKRASYINIIVTRKDKHKSGICVPNEAAFMSTAAFSRVVSEAIETLSEHCRIAMSVSQKK